MPVRSLGAVARLQGDPHSAVIRHVPRHLKVFASKAWMRRLRLPPHLPRSG